MKPIEEYAKEHISDYWYLPNCESAIRAALLDACADIRRELAPWQSVTVSEIERLARGAEAKPKPPETIPGSALWAQYAEERLAAVEEKLKALAEKFPALLGILKK